MMKKDKKVVKADQEYDIGFEVEKGERQPTEFEFVKAKVEALEEVVSTLQMIIKQNKLVYTTEDNGSGDVEDMAWRSLEEEDG